MFASPLFLWALLATAVPLMLHMFQKRRTVHVLFPTVQFLKAAQRRSSSRVRFENFLLWLLRTLLIVFLVLAFAEPVLRSVGGAAWLGRTPRDVAIVLDGSYSMNYDVDRGQVWNLGKEAAERVVRSLQPGDRVCVYLASDSVIPIIEKPTSEFPTVITAIQTLECRDGSSHLDEASALALRAISSGEKKLKRERELFIITDGQALPWRGFQSMNDESSVTNRATGSFVISREDRDEVAVYTLLAGAARPVNANPSDVAVSPPLSIIGQTMRVRAKIALTGAASEVPVTLMVDGKEYASRSVKIEADSSATADFQVTGLSEGDHVAEIRTPRDALETDDAFRFLMRVRGRLPMLAVGPEEATRFLRAALAPGGKDAIRNISAQELDSVDLRDYRAVFLCDAFPVPGQAMLNLESYAESGGVVVVFPGNSSDLSAYSEMKILPAALLEEQAVATGVSACALKRHPPVRGREINFTLPLPPGTIPTVALKKRIRFGELNDKASVIISTSAGDPFLLGRICGRGRVFLFSVGATRDWSTLPISAFFLPIVHQLVRLGTGASMQPAHLTLGQSLPAVEAIADYRDDNVILAPSKTPVSIKDAGNMRRVIETLPEVGIYMRSTEGGPKPVMAVNADATESLLAPADAEEISKWTEFRRMVVAHDSEEMMKISEDRRNGRSFTEWVLWLALILSLAEWWYANSVLRPRKGATEKLKISLSGKVTNEQ